MFSSVSGILKTATGGGQRADKKARATKTSPADVVSVQYSIVGACQLTMLPLKISWSGCKDSQTSADTVEAGQSTGAMSFVRISDGIHVRRGLTSALSLRPGFHQCIEYVPVHQLAEFVLTSI